jgi:hypothetical protein
MSASGQTSPEHPRVFISYSHDSPEHKQRVLALSDRLRNDGIEAELDQYQTRPPQGWSYGARRSSFALQTRTLSS